jgi:sugar phosphate isomerase/epimerase
MLSAVTVSLVAEARSGPFVFWEGLEDACVSAAELGFDAIEVFPPSAEAVDAHRLRTLVDRHHLRVAAFGTGGGWVVRRLTLTHPDPSVRSDALEFIGAIVDLAAGFGAPAIIGSMQGRWDGTVTRAQALVWLGEALEQLGERAGRRGTTLLYEPLNRYETNLFNRIGEAAGWLQTLSTPHVRVLADLFHMNIEEADLVAALRDAGRFVGHVHFADSNRRAVGFGHTDMGPIVAALRDLGYAGFLSAEILPFPDSMTAARQTISAFRRHACR